MLIIIFYILALICSYVLFFRKGDHTQLKKRVVQLHLASVAIMLIEYLLWTFTAYRLYGAWTFPVAAVLFLITGTLLMVVYWKTTNLFLKIYGGIFFFYPLLIVLAAFTERLFMAILISIPLAMLFTPETVGYGNSMSIKKEFSGVLGYGTRVLLYKSYFPLEKKIGETYVSPAELKEMGNLEEAVVKGDSVVVFYNHHRDKLKFLRYELKKGR